MVTKGTIIVEETDPWNTKKKTKSKKRKRFTKEAEKKEKEEIDTPLRSIFCLTARQDMKNLEEKEDCFILDFDPNDSFDQHKLSSISDSPENDDDVAIIHEKGQVACRDFPHPRHLCSKFPFGTTQHATHCNQCYCYVCDSAAPCSQWTSGVIPHCDAIDNNIRKCLRECRRNLPAHQHIKTSHGTRA